jgi:predicted nuclease of restriction endonuclease-like (RecB) superfamily
MTKKMSPSSNSLSVKKLSGLPSDYPVFLKAVKERIRSAQVKATFAVNNEMVVLYWDIGRAIIERQARAGWGAAIIPKLARDIRNEMPEVKGFSERNIGYMIRFAREYGKPLIMQQGAAKNKARQKHSLILQQVAAKLPWFHNVLLMEKVSDLDDRLWYMQQTIEQGWSRDRLSAMIKSAAHRSSGKVIHNFSRTLPPAQSDLAEQSLKDPYIFDFLTLSEPFHERELELGLLAHVEKFLLELGQGFAFVGRQYLLNIGAKEFYLDLLFYHLRLRCFIVVDLKRGPFKPEYAGKMNFYCNVVDAQLCHEQDRPTIGLILCQDKNQIIAEYALKGVTKAIGVSEYQITRALPKELKSSLPTIKEIERALKDSSASKEKR